MNARKCCRKNKRTRDNTLPVKSYIVRSQHGVWNILLFLFLFILIKKEYKMFTKMYIV